LFLTFSQIREKPIFVSAKMLIHKKGSQCKKSKILCTLAAIFVISPAPVTFLFAYFALNALNSLIHI
ncbi:hypothetical protein, partial [Blautia obeum]|uniref:hypothetical protein n=1 Tax=Blautia obeum TaxID=40520 RepID=UPI001A9B7FAE